MYEALVEHSIVDGKDKMKIDRNAVYDDGNENHGIGSAGLQVIIDLARRLVICKDNYTSFRIVTAYPYPSFDEMDQWYDAVDQGF